MNDIVWTRSYEDYKTEVGQELTRASESFVKIGYLLKAARDTDVLKDSEYGIGNYIQFAEKEFGLEKTQVSRFIRINDRFSEGGNSDVLREEYRGYGTRKLGIMLTLPEELTEELSPDYTVEEMGTIQQEVKEEQAITPLEQYAEELEAEKTKEPAAELAKDDILGAAIYQIMEDRPELFAELYECEIGKTREIIAPVEDTMYICRVLGVGKLMVICKEEKISIVNARTNEKSFYSYEDVNERLDELDNCRSYKTAKEAWEAIYNKPFPEEIEPKTDNFGSKKTENAQKPTENAQKKAEKTKNEKKRVNVTKEKKTLCGSYIDSGVNILSVCSRLVPLEAMTLRSHQPRYTPDKVVYTSQTLLADGQVEICMHTGWDRGLNHKSTRLWFSGTNTQLLLDHSGQSVWKLSGESRELLFREDSRERLVNHYIGVFGNFAEALRRPDSSAYRKQAEQVHRLLLLAEKIT